MSLDEIIEYGDVDPSEQIANKATIDKNMINCVREHKQLIDWLKELKEFREDRRMEIRASILKLACDMEQKLRDNDHKGGWLDDSYEQLLDRLREEVKKLEEKLFPNDPMPIEVFSKKSGSYKIRFKEAIKECVDVANFSMMIADKLRKEGG